MPEYCHISQVMRQFDLNGCMKKNFIFSSCAWLLQLDTAVADCKGQKVRSKAHQVVDSNKGKCILC